MRITKYVAQENMEVRGRAPALCMDLFSRALMGLLVTCHASWPLRMRKRSAKLAHLPAPLNAVRIRTPCRRPALQPLTDCRVVHRALNSYFDAYSAALGRYIPSRKLQVGGCGVPTLSFPVAVVGMTRGMRHWGRLVHWVCCATSSSCPASLRSLSSHNEQPPHKCSGSTLTLMKRRTGLPWATTATSWRRCAAGRLLL